MQFNTMQVNLKIFLLRWYFRK